MFAFLSAIPFSTTGQQGTTVSTAASTATATMIDFSFFGIFLLFFLLFLTVGIILSIFAWKTMKDIDRGMISKARSNSLILGIVGLIFGSFISGIFFILAYSKLSESATQFAPIQTLPQRFCVNCGKEVPPNAKFCIQCGKELPP